MLMENTIKIPLLKFKSFTNAFILKFQESFLLNKKFMKLMINQEAGKDYIQKRLYFYHFLNDGITFILPTLMAIFYFEFNLNWYQTGLIFAFNSLATIIFQIIIGYYTDKNRSETLMKIGLFLLTITCFLMIFSYDFVSLFLFALFIGIALAFQHSISYATTSRMYQEKKDIMIGRQGAAGDAGKCIAVLTSALIIILLHSWKLVLMIWAIISLLTLIIIMLNFKSIKFENYFIEKNEDVLLNDDLPQKRNTIILILILIIYILYLAIYSLLITNLATYLSVERKGLVSEYSGLILGYTLVFGVIGAYLSGYVKIKFGMIKSLIVFSIFTILLLISYICLNTNNLLINLILLGLIGFLLFLMYPQLLAAINSLFQHKKVGFGYGLILSMGWLGNFLGSLIGGYFANLYSGIIFFYLSIYIFLIIIILTVLIHFGHSID